MGDDLINALKLSETDVEGAMERLSNDEELYKQLLAAFPDDKSMLTLDASLADNNWDDAYTAVHALKGLASNLGFIPLAHALGLLVILIRSGRIDEIDETYKTVKKIYNDIISTIKIYI